MEEHIKFQDETIIPVKGNIGLHTQLPGLATTVGNLSSATGGVAPGNIVTTDK